MATIDELRKTMNGSRGPVNNPYWQDTTPRQSVTSTILSRSQSNSRPNGLQSIIDQFKAPKISPLAGHYQFLNTLEPEEKYEYLLEADPSRAAAMRQTAEKQAEGWKRLSASVPVSNQPDASKDYFRNFAVPPARTEEEKKAISAAESALKSTERTLQQFDAADKRDAERQQREAIKRAAPTYAMLATLPEDEVIEYLKDTNPAIAAHRKSLNEQVQHGRQFYGMTIDQYEEELVKAEQEFYGFYTTEYNPSDPASEAKYERLNERYTNLLNSKNTAWMLGNQYKYSAIPQNEDFAIKSNFTWDSRKEREKLEEKGFNDHELSIYTYIFNTEGKKAADTYADYVIYMDTAKKNAAAIEATKELAKEDAENLNLMWSSLKSIGATIASGAGMMDAMAQKGGQVLGEMFGGGIRAPVDFNSAAMKPSVYATTVLQTNAERLNEKHGTIELNPETNPLMAHIFNGKGMGDVYQLTMSMVNSGIAAGMSAVIPFSGLGMLSGSAATSTMLRYAENGATDEQAIAMGLIAGFAEAVMEALPMESLLNGKWTHAGFGQIMKQGLTEGGEEVGTTLLNTAADILIMAKNSDFTRNIKAYEDSGMSSEAAYKRALLDKVIEVGWDFIGGFVSGGVTGSVATLGGRGVRTVSVLDVKKAQPLSVYKALTPALVDRVLEADPFDKQALEIRETMNKGGIDSVKASDIYKLVADNVDEYNATVYSVKRAADEAAKAVQAATEAIAKPTAEAMQPASNGLKATTAKSYSAIIQNAVDKLKQGPVTSSVYNAVYDAALADLDLQGELRVDLTAKGGLTKAQQREAVRHALQDIAKEQIEAESVETQTKPITEEEPVAKVSEQINEAPKKVSVTKSTSSPLDVAVEAYKRGDKNAVTRFTSAAMNSTKLQATIRKVWGVDLSKAKDSADKRAMIANALQAQSAKVESESAENVGAKPAAAKPVSSGDFAKVLSRDEYIKENGLYELPSKMQTDAYRQYVNALTDAVVANSTINYKGDAVTFDKYLEARNSERSAEGKGNVDESTARIMFYRNYVDELRSTEKAQERTKELVNLVDAINAKLEGFGSKFTVRISTSEADFPSSVKGETAFVNEAKKEIVLNGRMVTTKQAVLRKVGHEIFHPGANYDIEFVEKTIKIFKELNEAGKLNGKAKAWMDDADGRIADLQEIYQRHENATKGDAAQEVTLEQAKVEFACDLFGEMFDKTEMAKDLVEKDHNYSLTLVDRLNKVLAKLKLGHIETKAEKELKEIANKLSELEAHVRSAISDKAKTGEGISKNHSISSTAAAVGIRAIKDENGRITFVRENGTPVKRVIAADIEKTGGVGVLIRLAKENGYISEADAKIQYRSVASIMNMIIKTQDPEMVWKFVGASMFSAIKTNSDGQYGTTVDFSTVCRKTQDMIDAMSDAMKKLGRGLTKAEVTQLQKKLIEEGATVPCPVCYVFSRWAGIGSVLDKMRKWQDKYANYNKEELEARIKYLKNLDEKMSALLVDAKSEMYDDEYFEYSAKLEKLSAEIKENDKKLKKASEEDVKKLKSLNYIKERQVSYIKEQMKMIEDAAKGELVWLQKVRTQDGYRAVPPKVLFDLGSGDVFANEYPLSWGYRTSRGPGVGKAISPYADMRFGDIILGADKNSAHGKETFTKIVENEEDKTTEAFAVLTKKDEAGRDKLNTIQERSYDTARKRTVAQNLIGGQRLQSTSDFRYDYALDYVLAFFEIQALGSNVQTYTKILEFADMVASIGGDVNLSVMPKDKGYENGKLIFSNVTGVDYDGAVKVSNKYDNAQLILVGINDEHIRLALEDSGKTGGINIGFVIPYHASGASIESFIKALVENLGEDFVLENYTDYSRVQNDSERVDATEDQVRRGLIRDRLLTGQYSQEYQTTDKNGNPVTKKKTVAWTPNDADFELIFGESADISGRSFEDLRSVERRALDGDPDAIREYESWSAGILQKLFEKFWDKNSKYYQVRLSGKQSAKVMPFEYWDTNTTRDNAYINGFIFRSYCYSMGLNPRFTGYDNKGATVDFGDFSDSTGYWKTLIDRPMYANDGTYRDQQNINVTRLRASKLKPSGIPKYVAQYKVQEPSAAKAQKAADKFVQDTRAKEQSELSFSLDDETYLDAVNRNDMETAQRMVDKAANLTMPNSILREGDAINKGEDEEGTLIKMYHGSGANNFNVFEPRDGMLGNGVYLTSNWEEAVGYAMEKLGIEEDSDGNYGWNGERYYGIGDIGEALESAGYVRAFYANVTDKNDVAKSSVYWEDVIALVRDNTQLKSADPVTYDDNGNVIPLSERFNAKSSDIRYSIEDDTDSIGAMLTPGQKEYFKDSKVRDSIGRLIRLFHGTQAFGFTEVDFNKSDDGISFFMTDNPTMARSYSGTDDIRSVVEGVMNPDAIDPMTADLDTVADEYHRMTGREIRALKTESEINDWIDSQLAWAQTEVRHTKKMLNTLVESIRQLPDNGSQNTKDAFEALPAFEELALAYDMASSAVTPNASSEEMDLTADALDEAWKSWNNLSSKNTMVNLFGGSIRPRSVAEALRLSFDAKIAAERGLGIFAEGYDYIWDEEFIRQDLANAYTYYGVGDAGNYALYANLTDPLIIDANGQYWNSIKVPEEYLDEMSKIKGREAKFAKTRDFARLAKALNKDGVIFRQLVDYGAADYIEDDIPATVVIAFKSNSVKDVHNENPTENDDLRYSLDEDLGYHAGDLGKSEHLGMISGDRDTGHFGFGTYFVGDRKKIEGYNRRNGAEAPVETVDFSQYHLYRPATNDDGFVLHRFLRSLNTYYDRDPNLVQTPEEYDQAKENIDDYRYEVEELGNTELEEQLIGVAESVLGKYGVARVVQGKLPVDAWLADDGTLELTDGTRLDIMEAVNMVDDVRDVNIAIYDEVANRWTESAVYRYDGWRYQVQRDSEDLFNLTPAEVDAIVSEIRDEIAAGNYNWETAKGQDSASTRFMKKLGYEGIDVRHLSQLDNTTYGSVIYDLKGKDIARKQEIGTARYSLEDDELSALEDQFMQDLAELDSVEGASEISDQYAAAFNKAIEDAKALAIEQTKVLERRAAEMGRKREQADMKRKHQVKLKAIKAEAASKADNAKLAENMGHQREMLQQKRKYEAKLATQKADYEQRLETAKEEAAVRLGNVKLAEKMGHQREMLQQKRELKEKAKIAVASEKEKGKAVADSLKAKSKQQRQLSRNKAKIALRAQSAAKKKMAQEAIKNGEVKTVREYEAVTEFADVFKTDVVMRKSKLAAQAVADKIKAFYKGFTSGGYELEVFSRRQTGVQAQTCATMLQSASTTIDRVFKEGLVDPAGNTIGKSLADVLLVYQTKNGKATSKVDMQKMAIFQDYLLHAHNVDRMSIEEKAMAEVSAFLEKHAWVDGMTDKEIARIASLTDKEAAKEGEVETRAILGEYLTLLENVNKAKNKPVFADNKGNAVSAETSRAIVAKYEAEHAWLAEKAQGLYEWWDTYMRTWVVGTSVTAEQYESMRTLYPHYVPTFRVVKKGSKSFGGTTLSPTQVVKAAKGSTLSIIDIENSFARLVSNGITGYRENELFKNVIDTLMLDDGDTKTFGDMGYFDDSVFEDESQVESAPTEEQTQEKIETDEKVGLVKDKDGYRVSAWYDGELRSAYVSKELFEALQHYANEDLGEGMKQFMRIGSILTAPMKTALTGVNMAFAVRNVARDFPTAIINSISGVAFPLYWAQAGYDMAAAGIISNEQLANILSAVKVDVGELQGHADRYQTFLNLGGMHSGYYNAHKGFIENVKGRNLAGKTLEAMGAFNEATEAITRYAEYIATLDKLGDTYENRLLAIYNAAEVTVNFGRHGKYGQVINAWIPYWNAAVQGIDKVFRSVFNSPDGKKWYHQAVKTLGRAAVTSLLPEVLLAIAYARIRARDDRDDWEELTDRARDTYYCVPVPSQKKYLKIPKNREWGAILGTPFMRLLEYANGRQNPFENYVETSLIPNFLPPGITDAIGLSQAKDLWLNKDFAGRQIVPTAYLDGSKELQYDADTSVLARALAAMIGYKLGPMQVDYLIESCFGDFGEMAIKLFAPATWQEDPEATAAALLDIVVSPWFVDSRYSNQNVSDYYELLDRLDVLAQDAKNHGTEDEFHATPDYLAGAAIDRLYGSRISALNKQAREMNDGAEKDAIKEEIARLAKEALMLDAAIRSGDFSEYANASTIFDADTTKALLELYKGTNSVSVFLQEPDRKFSVNGVEVVLGDDELEAYSQNRRDIATPQIAELVSSERYSNMSVEERAKAVGQVYDYATQIAKQNITNGEYKPAAWMSATQQAMQEVGLPMSAVVDYRIALANENDKPDVTAKQANSTIRGQLMADTSLPAEQRNALDDIVFSDVTIIPNDKKVDYTNEETFVITQMSEGAQTRWPDIKRRFQISAETYSQAWSIYYDDELTAAEKKAKLGVLIGSTLRGNGLYRALGEKLDK